MVIGSTESDDPGHGVLNESPLSEDIGATNFIGIFNKTVCPL